MNNGATRLNAPESLDEDSGRALFESLEANDVERGGKVVIDLSQTKTMDSRGGAWLMELATELHARDAKLEYEGASDRVERFMEMIRPGLAAVEPKDREPDGFFTRLGGSALKVVAEAREIGELTVDAIYWTVIGPFDGKRIRWALVVDELHEMGVRAIRINVLMNFLLGLIIAMLSSAQLEAFGAQIFVADLVVIAFARELAAVMTAIVVSARTGAAIAAEIATMKVQEEIDALRGMGLNVAQFLVTPKLIAMLIVMPCLIALGMVAGVAGGTVWGVFALDIDFEAWRRELMGAAEFSDAIQGMTKGLLFAVTIVMIGCHNGLRVQGGSRGVGLMTTRAVVWDIFAIITIDMVFAALFYYVL